MRQLTILMILLISAGLFAATITVNADGTGDYPTIQTAINNAVNGDTVLVADGVYTGDGNRDINFLGKAITVKSQNGPTNCIIDASDEVTFHRGFIFESMETSASVVEGFTVTGGFVPASGPTAGGGGGGAVVCYASTPSIRNCIFFGNSTEGAGGAIYFAGLCDDWPVLKIKNSTFYGNAAAYGGVSSIQGTHFNEISFTNCILKDNIATDEPLTNNFHEQVIAKCGPVVTSVDFSILDFDWANSENSIIADPLFADPNNGDFHLKSEYGRWDPVTQTWVTDDVTSPGIDFGDPNDDYSNEPPATAGRINAGAYGNTPEASFSDSTHCYTGPDYTIWLLLGMPESWCTPYQCHGDADGDTEIIAKQSRRVGYHDINILLAGFNQPYSGNPNLDGSDWDDLPDTWIAADFDHDSEHVSKSLRYVGYGEINVLLQYFNNPDVPGDCQTPNPVSP
ncbi:MAG: DUF5123 domain-containing protein [Phycisphaerae bacterium]|nr:DUF5123 domain-containing protein [Phycisphaerae bacterium]